MKLNNYIYLIVSICVVVIVYLYFISQRQENDIVRLSHAIRTQNVAKKDSLVDLIEQQQFKENFYTTQLSIQSDWIILYVTILFGIFGIIGFKFFSDSIDTTNTSLKNIIKTEIKNQEDNYILHKSELKKLKQEHYFISAEMYLFIAENDKDNNISKFILYIRSAYFYKKTIELEGSDIEIKVLVNTILYVLRKAIESIMQVKNINESDLTVIKDNFQKINHDLFELNSLKYLQIRDLCAQCLIEITKLYKH